MQEKLVNSVGQSLVAIGLYTVAFESMVLSLRAQMYGHLLKESPVDAETFVEKHCFTADKTFKYCKAKLLSLGILTTLDIQSLDEMRDRRNHFAHSGYNDMFMLHVKDIDAEVVLMHKITEKLQHWNQEVHTANPDGSVSFKISPSIFGLYRAVAIELAATKLFVADTS